MAVTYPAQKGLKRLAQQLKRCGLCSAMTRAKFKTQGVSGQAFFHILEQKKETDKVSFLF